MAQERQERPKMLSCDDYFETIQSRKKLPKHLQQSLTSAFAKIPVSSFPDVPGGKGKHPSLYYLRFYVYKLISKT